MDRVKNFKMIMEKSSSNRVMILTSQYQIFGEVYECSECNKEEFINLTNASICNINDSYGGECGNEMRYDWLHINLDKVVGYSFV